MSLASPDFWKGKKMSIDRYYVDDHGGAELSQNGEYVEYSDHKEIVEGLEKKIKDLKIAIENAKSELEFLRRN